jgi:hypothetical protein
MICKAHKKVIKARRQVLSAMNGFEADVQDGMHPSYLWNVLIKAIYAYREAVAKLPLREADMSDPWLIEMMAHEQQV